MSQIIYLTPLIPLSFKGEGECFERVVLPLFDLPKSCSTAKCYNDYHGKAYYWSTKIRLVT